MKVRDVTRRDIERLHRRLESKPFEANRCLEILKAAFAMAEKLEIRQLNSNPTTHVTAYPEPRRKDQHRLEEADARAYLDVLPDAVAATASSTADFAGLALFIAAFRGLRIGEVLSLRWPTISRDCRRAVITGKTGTRAVDLPQPVADRLKSLRPAARSDVVIAGADPTTPLQYSTRSQDASGASSST